MGTNPIGIFKWALTDSRAMNKADCANCLFVRMETYLRITKFYLIVIFV